MKHAALTAIVLAASAALACGETPDDSTVETPTESESSSTPGKGDHPTDGARNGATNGATIRSPGRDAGYSVKTGGKRGRHGSDDPFFLTTVETPHTRPR